MIIQAINQKAKDVSGAAKILMPNCIFKTTTGTSRITKSAKYPYIRPFRIFKSSVRLIVSSLLSFLKLLFAETLATIPAVKIIATLASISIISMMMYEFNFFIFSIRIDNNCFRFEYFPLQNIQLVT